MRIPFLTAALLLLSKLSICHSSSHNSSFLHVLVVLSFEAEGSVNTNIPWIQGRDIFRGATLAARDISQNIYLLPQSELVPILVLVPDCDPVKGIDKFLQTLQDPSINIIGVSGMFCDRVAEVYIPIIEQSRKTNSQIFKSLLRNKRDIPIFSGVRSYEDVASGVISVLQGLKWTRFGLVYTSISANANFPYWTLANSLMNHNAAFSSSIEIVYHYMLNKINSREISSFIQKAISNEVNVLVFSVSPIQATQIVDYLVEQGLQWPQYVLIFVLMEPSSVTLTSVWENVIFMFYKINDTDTMLFPSSFRFYETLLYDTVLAMALAVNNSFTSVTTSTKTWKENLPHATQYQVFSNATHFYGNNKQLKIAAATIKNDTVHLIGHYSFENNNTYLNTSLLQPLPSDKFEFVYFKLPLFISVSLYLLLSLVYILVTADLVLFVLFRKHKEVKASSISLSICIFVGNYLMLLSASNYAIRRGLLPSTGWLRQLSCNIDFIGFSVGLDLAVATALVKTFRIWHIFHHFTKLNKDWTDSRLVQIIVSIASIKLYIFALWISVDNVHVIDKLEFQNSTASLPYYLIFQSCYCEYHAFWLTVTCLYTSVLLIFLFHLAFKTRNVNHKDFKDTKKLTVLIVSQLMILVVGGLLWGILRKIGQRIASYSSLILAYVLSVFLIQIFLFLPKVLPPLYRHIQKSKPITSFKKNNGSGFYHLYK